MLSIKRAGANKHIDHFRVAFLLAQLFRGSHTVLTDRLTHLLQRCNPLTKRATADNLFLGRWRLLKLNTGLAIQFTNGTLNHHRKMLANMFWIGIGQIQSAINPHLLKTQTETPTNSPDLIDR